MIQTSFEWPPDSGVASRSMDPQANGSETRNSTAVGDPAGGGHDGARAQRHRRVVALLLEEAHPGGEDRRGPAGQRAERRWRPRRPPPARTEADRPRCRCLPRPTPRSASWARTNAMMTQSQSGPDHGVEGLGDVDQHADQGPAADERADHHDQRRPAHPARLHQLRHVDRLGLGGALPHLLQQLALAPQAPAERGVERRPVQMPAGRRSSTSALQAPGRGRGGPLGADRHRRRRDGAGQVTVELVRRGVRARRCGSPSARRSPRPGRPAARHR